MILRLTTKSVLILIISLLSCSVWSQEKEEQEEDVSSSNGYLSRGVKGSLGFAYNFVNPVGDKYIGLAYKGNGGFSSQFKLFVFDGIFIGGALGYSYFENTNPNLTGDYDKTRVGSFSGFLGYEYQPIEKVAIGVNASVLGRAYYKNTFKGTSTNFQRDNAKLQSFGAYLDYFIDPNFSINLSYTYRNDKTNIETSSNLQPIFSHAQFSIIALGFNFQFGKESIISSFKN